MPSSGQILQTIYAIAKRVDTCHVGEMQIVDLKCEILAADAGLDRIAHEPQPVALGRSYGAVADGF